MGNQIHMYKTQAVSRTWASCFCVKIDLVPRSANISMKNVVRWPNMEPTCWCNVGPMSKITMGQHRRATLGRYNDR